MICAVVKIDGKCYSRLFSNNRSISDILSWAAAMADRSISISEIIFADHTGGSI